MKLQPLVYNASSKSFSYDGSAIDTCAAILDDSTCSSL